MSGSLSLSTLCPNCPTLLVPRIHTLEWNHLVYKGTEMGSCMHATHGVRGKTRPLPAASLLVQGQSLSSFNISVFLLEEDIDYSSHKAIEV